MKSIVSEKGQVTIPKELRVKLGLRPGTVLEFEAVEGKLVATKKDPSDPFSRWMGKGKLPANLGVDDCLGLIRG
jgi:AbrB family looped-hinge helix DNA binding protein